MLFERDATHAAVAASLPGATHLHFSCHGTFDVREPLDSALSLSGDDTLTLRDLLDGGLDLSAARLAVLSACQTGIVDFDKVPDEAIGFPAGFIQAGVPGVVSTLWPVDAISTAILMSRFYVEHLGNGLRSGLGPASGPGLAADGDGPGHEPCRSLRAPVSGVGTDGSARILGHAVLPGQPGGEAVRPPVLLGRVHLHRRRMIALPRRVSERSDGRVRVSTQRTQSRSLTH